MDKLWSRSTQGRGKRCCTGKHGELKATQQYTEDFGLGVAAAIRDSPHPCGRIKDRLLPCDALVATPKLKSGEGDDYDAEENPWCDLELEPCLDYLLTSLRATE